jgi:hypothetical protein
MRPLFIVGVGIVVTIGSAAFPLLTCGIPEHGDEYWRNRAEPADAFQRSAQFATDRVSVRVLHGALFTPETKTVPSWAWDRSQVPDEGLMISAIESIAAGWPKRCFVMRGYEWRTPNGEYGIARHGAFQYSRPNLATSLMDGCVPTHMIWKGAVLNMLFWCGVAVIFSWGGNWTRRVLRGRNGRCVACGYDMSGLRGQPCPECGDGMLPED